MNNPIYKKIIRSRSVKLINLPPFGRKYRVQLGRGKTSLFFQYVTVDSNHIYFDGMKNGMTGETSLNYSDDTALLVL